MKDSKRNLFEGAGLMSEQTAILLEKEIVREEAMRKLEEARKKFHSINYSTLIGNSKPFNARDPTLSVPNKMLPNIFKDFNSNEA